MNNAKIINGILMNRKVYTSTTKKRTLYKKIKEKFSPLNIWLSFPLSFDFFIILLLDTVAEKNELTFSNQPL